MVFLVINVSFFIFLFILMRERDEGGNERDLVDGLYGWRGPP